MRQPADGGAAEKVLEVPGAELDAFRCSSNPKASSPCVLGLLEGKDLIFYSLDPVKGKGRRIGEITVISYPWVRGWHLAPDGSRLAVVDRHKYGERIEELMLADGTWYETLSQPDVHTPEAAGGDGFFQVAWAADGKNFFVNRLPRVWQCEAINRQIACLCALSLPPCHVSVLQVCR